MGTVKYKDAVLELVRKTPVVTIGSIRKIAGEQYVHLLIHTLAKKGLIHRITKGWYSRFDDPTMAVFCFQPAYLGLQNALSIHNIWEQETNTIILTAKKVREGTREIFGNNVVLRRIPSRLYFGVEYVQYGDAYFPVSDIEKTFLDFVYFKQPLDREVLNIIKRKIDRGKLKKYLKLYCREFSVEFLKETGIGSFHNRV